MGCPLADRQPPCIGAIQPRAASVTMLLPSTVSLPATLSSVGFHSFQDCPRLEDGVRRRILAIDASAIEVDP